MYNYWQLAIDLFLSRSHCPSNSHALPEPPACSQHADRFEPSIHADGRGCATSETGKGVVRPGLQEIPQLQRGPYSLRHG